MKQKKRLSRRFMAFLLTAVLVLSSLSLSAFAEASGDESADAAEEVTADESADAAEEVTAAEETVTVSEDEAAEADEDGVSAAASYTDSSGYTFESVTVSYSTYSWSSSATSSTRMSGYYYAVTSDSTTTYYPVYYTYSSSSNGPNTTVTISLTYYDGSSYQSISTSLTSTGSSTVELYVVYTYSSTMVTYNTVSWNTSYTYQGNTYGSTDYYYAVTDSSGNTTYYSVYYQVQTTTTGEGGNNGGGGPNGNTTNATYTVYLYYYNGSQYVQISITLSSGSNDSSVALYTRTPDTSLDDDSSSGGGGSTEPNVSYELTLEAYSGDAYVYWDMDDENGTTYSVTFTTDSNDGSYTSTTATNYVSSVYLEEEEVNWFDSRNENFTTGSYGSENESENAGENNIVWDTDTAQLKDVYDVEDGSSDSETEESEATLTITPASGYYVSSIIVTCAAYVEASYNDEGDLVQDELRISPYYCGTYTSNNAYDGTFELTDNVSGSDLALSTEISNEYFSHSGYTDYDYDEDEDDAPIVYFILINVEEIPTPAYVEYDYGNILDYIEESDSEDDTDSTTSVFESAGTWTTANEGNVYNDGRNVSDSVTGSGGGSITYNTQFVYVYDDGSSSDSGESGGDAETTAEGGTGTEEESSAGYEKWEHYANAITADAAEEAAEAGYVFAGWAVTWYGDAEAEAVSDGSYNNYEISFSDYFAVSLVGEGDNVPVFGHVRLVAQWVAIEDITQVIDYGLPVSVDLLDEIEDNIDDLKAVISDISSRTSTNDNLYEDATYANAFDVAVSNIQYEMTAETASDDGSTDETDTGSDDSSTANGTYGTFSVSNGEAVYTLTDQMTGVESEGYKVSLTYGLSTIAKPTGTITIIPATSVYYEENFGAVTTTSTDEDGNETSTTTYSLVTYNGKSSSGWSQTGTSENYTQEDGVVGTTDDSTYGADTSYLSNLQDSNGTSMYVCTTSGSASFSYTFTGTGTAIYGRISDDSGYLQVIVTALDEDGDTKKTDDEKTYYKTYRYIDTRVVENVSESTMLYNIPVFDVTDLEYGTYSVTVTVAKGNQAVLNATYDENGDEVADDETGNYFYLDGIRIYDPIKTSTELENSEYATVYDAYNADVEAENAVINISDKLLTESDAYGEDGSFISVTDAYGNLTGYDGYFVLGPDNEVYLDGENYTLTFYMVNWDSDTYHLYIGLKAPDGTAASVKIGNTTYSIGGSADCYYEITSALEEDTSSSLSNYSNVESVYKVTITGVSGLAALSYLKVTNASGFEIAYELNVTVDDEDDESSGESLDIETGTLYMISTTAYESLLEGSEEDSDTSDPEEDEDNDSEGDTEEDPDTEDDSEGDTEENPDTEDDSDTEADPENEDDIDTEDEVVETTFTPEKFTASISYLKLLKTATITVKTSGDVSYITVNGEKVTGRTLMGTQYFTYLASKVSSGTTYEVIAYDEDNMASDPITLTAK